MSCLVIQMKYIVSLVILFLLCSCSNVKLVSKAEEEKSQENKNRKNELLYPVYLEMGCCGELPSFYECHICSVLTFYEKLYEQLDFKEFDKFGRDFFTYIDISFNKENVSETVNVMEIYESEIASNISRLVSKVLSENQLKIIRMHPIYSPNTFQLLFEYYQDSQHCLEFPQSELTKTCENVLEKFDANIGLVADYDIRNLPKLSNQQNSISVNLNDYMWICGFEYNKPYISINNIDTSKTSEVTRRYK